MACASPSDACAPLNVWTRKYTADRVVHPVGPPVESGTRLELGLVTLKLDHRTV